jgi:CDP-diacylglycerol--glycerol-3-phosphate 3-phosphatidyltransferase
VNLPNFLTMGRMLLVPVVMLLMNEPTFEGSWWAAGLFVLAALTDFVDGYLARRWGQITVFGKLMDPMADKLLVLGCLLMLLNAGLVSPWLVFVLLGRELAVTSLRLLAAADGLVLAARPLGKQKTVFQMGGLAAMLVHQRVEWAGWTIDFHWWGTAALVVGAVLAVVSGVDTYLAFRRAHRVEVT